MTLLAVIIVGVALVVIYLFLRKFFSARSCESLDRPNETVYEKKTPDELDDSDLQETINQPSEEIMERQEQQEEIEPENEAATPDK
ncbi:MAG: hypothetical protein ACOX2A_11110 [Tepidanaerobacteraceae bacterium]